MKTLLFALVFESGIATILAAPDPRAAFVGTWRGTSTCVDHVRNPACKDEVVIYEVHEKSGDDRTVSLEASKVVDGKVLPMGDLDFTSDASGRTWTSEFQSARVHVLWSFVLDGNRIEGTLVDLPDRTLIRRIAAKKDEKQSKP